VFRGALLLVVAAAVLGACAELPEGPSLPPGGFELAGRIAVRHAKDGASGRIQWRHSVDTDDVLITSPIGQGIAHISRNGDEYHLTTGSGKEFRATDPESLTEQTLGWRLPLAGLPDWIQGRAAPGENADLRRDAEQRPLELRQDGWRVEYQEFRNGHPARLRMSREDLEIRLVVDRWTN
jgi:outer membrane lipoprotein LolB